MNRTRRALPQGLAAVPVLDAAGGCAPPDDPRLIEDDATRVAHVLRPASVAALACGGRYYLPYRLHATRAQFTRAYPEAAAFAELKRRVDPRRRFTNRLWDTYLP